MEGLVFLSANVYDASSCAQDQCGRTIGIWVAHAQLALERMHSACSLALRALLLLPLSIRSSELCRRLKEGQQQLRHVRLCEPCAIVALPPPLLRERVIRHRRATPLRRRLGRCRHDHR